MEDNRRLSGELYADRETFRARLLGAVEEAARVPGATEARVIMGYCFGGAAVLEAARAGAQLDGFAAFHAGLGTPEGQGWEGRARADHVLPRHGRPRLGAPPISPRRWAELEAAGVEHEASVYGGARHSFTVFGSDDYDLEADQASWLGLTRFLEERLR